MLHYYLTPKLPVAVIQKRNIMLRMEMSSFCDSVSSLN